MGTFVLGVRLLLAAVFAVAGIAKFRDEFGTRNALYEFRVRPGWIGFLAYALPATELVVAVALLFPPTARVGALLSLGLLAGFMYYIGRAVAQGRSPDCHCFGQLHSSPAGPRTLVRNGVLAALAIVVLVEGPGPSISTWIGDRSTPELVAVGAGIAAAVLAVLTVGLWADNRTLRRRLVVANEELSALPAGLQVGSPAPAFSVRELDGGEISLDDLLARGKPVLLVFAGADCGVCHLVLPDVGRWQSTLSDRLTIVVLASSAGGEENRRMAEEFGLSELLLQHTYEVMTAYRVHATPGAVLLTSDGRIAGETAIGPPAIEPLVRVALGQGPSGAESPLAIVVQHPGG